MEEMTKKRKKRKKEIGNLFVKQFRRKFREIGVDSGAREMTEFF